MTNGAHAAVEWEDPRPWPTTTAAMAYGLAGRITAALYPVSESDPTAILVQVLIAFGNVVGRNPYFQVEADRHYMNLFASLVGETSKGRKGTSWGQVAQLFAAVDPEWTRERVSGGLSSGEGLIWAVHDPITRLEALKEKGQPPR